MLTTRDLWQMSRRELAAVLSSGHAIDPWELSDWEYRGVALGLPRWFERLTWKTFKKAFHRDRERNVLRGWNVRLQQRGVDGPSIPIERRGAPLTFGHYHVVSARGRRMPLPAQGGLLIDYGLGGNARLDALQFMRDPLVAVNPGASNLLLGWSYLELGSLVLGTPSYFTLERDCALSHRVDPPRSAP